MGRSLSSPSLSFFVARYCPFSAYLLDSCAVEPHCCFSKEQSLFFWRVSLPRYTLSRGLLRLASVTPAVVVVPPLRARPLRGDLHRQCPKAVPVLRARRTCLLLASVAAAFTYTTKSAYGKNSFAACSACCLALAVDRWHVIPVGTSHVVTSRGTVPWLRSQSTGGRVCARKEPSPRCPLYAAHAAHVRRRLSCARTLWRHPRGLRFALLSPLKFVALAAHVAGNVTRASSADVPALLLHTSLCPTHSALIHQRSRVPWCTVDATVPCSFIPCSDVRLLGDAAGCQSESDETQKDCVRPQG